MADCEQMMECADVAAVFDNGTNRRDGCSEGAEAAEVGCPLPERARVQRQVSPRRVAVAASRAARPPKREPPTRVTARVAPPANRNKIGVRNKSLGRAGEAIAAQFLQGLDYEIIARNWSCMVGEADIVARDGSVLVFVEVKTRTSIEKGLPSDAVDERKRSKYERIATCFTQRYEVDSIPIRFDVVSILMHDGTALIRHHIDAFGVA